MRIADTLTGEKMPITTSPVRIYVCGVTVYDDIHIGHARTMVVFDVLRRHLESAGLQTDMIQNFTDVDDKIIGRAKAQNTSTASLSQYYIDRYFEDADWLNVGLSRERHPRATDHIPDMISLIRDLVDKKYAYLTDNGVYFSVSRFSGYGQLSKKRTDDLLSGARVGEDEKKRDPLDFALWKLSNTAPYYGSPWGNGRPGWHIECSAMSLKHLGPAIDIHGGGRDLIFPHHENEIAQSESHTGTTFAKMWMHVGMVTVNGEKMSKSTGNVKSVRSLSRYGPDVLRLFCLSGHYSKPVDFSEAALDEILTKWGHASAACSFVQQEHGIRDGAEPDGNLDAFRAALDDDLNTHAALNVFFGIVSEVNELVSSGRMAQNAATRYKSHMRHCMGILGLRWPTLRLDGARLADMIKVRERHRTKGNYGESDRIRDELAESGIILHDYRHGTFWVQT